MRGYVGLSPSGRAHDVGDALLPADELLDGEHAVAVGKPAEECGATLGRLRIRTDASLYPAP